MIIFLKHGKKLKKVAKREIPTFVRLFTNLLWANSPIEWIIEHRYNRKTLFVAISIPNLDEKIYRTFLAQDINERFEKGDLWGMASDCTEQIEAEIRNR